MLKLSLQGCDRLDSRNKRKKRAAYLIATVVLFLYVFVRIFIPEKITLLSLYIFLFASAVEVLQYFELVKVLGLEQNRVLSVLLGSTFDWKDIGCYAAGCLLLGFYEAVSSRRVS